MEVSLPLKVDHKNLSLFCGKIFEQKRVKGISLDPQTEKSFHDLSVKYDIKPPWINE